MQNKTRAMFSILLLVVAGIHGYAQVARSSEQEKIDQIISKLWSLRSGEWNSLSEAISEMGDAIIEPLSEKLRNEDTSGWSQYQIEWHQRRIAWALGKVGTERAISLLIEILLDKTLHDYGRYEAAMALRRMRTKQAVRSADYGP